MNSMKWVTDQLNLTTIIAIVGLVLSIATIFTNWWKGRVRLTVSFDVANKWNCVSRIDRRSSRAIVAAIFENRSSTAISITKIKFHFSNSDKVYCCEMQPVFVGHIFHRLIDTPTEYYERFVESAAFPIQLCAYGAAEPFLVFNFPKSERLCKASIYTNHGVVTLKATDLQYLCEFLQTHFPNPVINSSCL